MHLPDPLFPPLLKGHAVKAPTTARDEACRSAAAGTLGAGDLVWSRNTGRAECALILEPEVSLGQSCQMAALGFVALAEAIGHVGPPQLPVEAHWPDRVFVNSAAAGTINLTAPACDPRDVPPWLVLAISVTLSFNNDKREPGERLGETALDLEGAGEVTRTELLEALGRCLLAWLHTWGERGFRPVHDQWLYCAVGRDRDIEFEGVQGRVVGLDEDGNAMVRTRDGRVVAQPYLPHLMVWR